MLHVNDDNNDELFRRAAENYPLKVDNPDWEAVLNKMRAGDTNLKSQPASGKGKKRYLLLLLLLLPILFVAIDNQTVFFHHAPENKNSINEKPSSEHENKNPAEPSHSAGMTSPSSSIEPDKRIENEINHSLETVQQQKTDAGFAGKRKVAGNSSTENLTYTLNKSSVVTNSSAEKNNESVKKAASAIIGNEVQGVTLTNPQTEHADKNTAAANTISGAEVTIPQEGKIETKVANDTSASETIVAEKKSNSISVKREKHFYVGLIGGPDLSTIKLQSVQKIGIGVGIITGYRISKKISLETGMIYDKKYYNTDGQYFNTKGMSPQPLYTIEYVKGSCNMWELPINLQYTIRSKGRSSLFLAAGFSSYFMNSEAYVFDVNYNGNRYPRSYKYHNKSTSLFAETNLSVGYTYQLGKIGELRIEPYIKLPVSKIGTGKLPIQSGGVYFGLTKSLF